jgi:branched-subunit amino acid transport protein
LSALFRCRLIGVVLGSFLGRALSYVPIALLADLLGPRVHRVLRRYGALAVASSWRRSSPFFLC